MNVNKVNNDKLTISNEVIVTKNNNNNIIPYYNNTPYHYNNRTIDQCGVILLNGANYPLVLLVHQVASNKWGLPKGHLTDKEKLNKDYYFCAKRELFEETGIMLSTNKHRRYNSLLLNKKLFYVVQMFKEFIYVQPIDKNEISDFIWYPILELDQFIKKNNCNRTIKDLENVMFNIKSKAKAFGFKNVIGKLLT